MSEEVAKAFVQHFYSTFDTNPDAMGTLYSDQSMLTFEGQQLLGSQSIVGKIKSVGAVKHEVKSMDIQPTALPNAINIFVTGSVKIGSDNPLHFCESFILMARGENQWYIHNDVMRLNYGL